MVAGEATALAFDARHDELVKLDARTGALDLAARRRRTGRRSAAGAG